MFAMLLPLNLTLPVKVPPLAFSVPFTVTEAAVNVTPPAKPESDQVSLADVGADAVAERLRAVDPNTLSPLEALRLLFELKNDLG